MALARWKSEEGLVEPWWTSDRSLLPYLRRNVWRDDFGWYPTDWWSVSKTFRDIERHAWDMERRVLGETSREVIPIVGKDGFEVIIDTLPFRPYEISVKTDDISVLIEGKHVERRNGNAFVTREFHRRYFLPPAYDTDKVTAELSSEGWLTVKCPPPPPWKTVKWSDRVIRPLSLYPNYKRVYIKSTI